MCGAISNVTPYGTPALGHSPVRWGIPRLDGLFPGSGAQMGHAGVKFPLILTILEKSLPCRLSLSKHFQNLVTVECRTFQFGQPDFTADFAAFMAADRIWFLRALESRSGPPSQLIHTNKLSCSTLDILVSVHVYMYREA